MHDQMRETQKIDCELKEAIKEGLGSGSWGECVRDVLGRNFPMADFSYVRIVGYEIVGPLVGRIKIVINFGVERDQTFKMAPSDMTEFGAMVLGFCLKRKHKPQTIQTLMGLFGSLRSKIFISPEEFNPKYIDVLAEWSQKFKSCSVKPEFDYSNRPLIVTFYGTPNKIRAIPKNWNLHKIAACVLATGDLPTPAMAQKIMETKEQNGKYEQFLSRN